MNDIFAIPTNAGQAEAAWEFINYVCGADYARLLPNVNTEELPARMPSEWEDELLKPFYQLDRITHTTVNTLRSLPTPVIQKMDEILKKYMADMLSGKTTVAEVLQAMESELQATLDAAEK